MFNYRPKTEIKFSLEDKERLGKLEKSDVIAIMIAQFQILMPLALITVAVFGLLMLFLLKVWLRA